MKNRRGGGMRLAIITANSNLAEVLAEEVREVRSVEVVVIDIGDVDSGVSPLVHDIIVVCELVLDRWCLWRTGLQSSTSSMEVVGSIGSRWLLHESPESLGFVGCIDLKLPAHDLVNQLHTLWEQSMRAHESIAISTMKRAAESPCHDDIDRRIVAYITLGLSDREIAAKVHLSSQTVRNRVSRILVRTHLENRTQLAMMCVHDPGFIVVHQNDGTSTLRVASGSTERHVGSKIAASSIL